MRAYLIFWPIFMILCVGPAFNFAAIAGMVPYQDLSNYIVAYYQEFWIPDPLAVILSYPTSLLALLLPSTSTALLALFALFLPGGYGVFLFSCVLAFIPAPFAEEIRDKLDAKKQAQAASA
ncbi:hypothetical protein ACYPKM_01115 [Pseudomonas aeruginosa]